MADPDRRLSLCRHCCSVSAAEGLSLNRTLILFFPRALRGCHAVIL
jgi:hypothetical protein